MKYKHYAPKGELYIVSGSRDGCIERIKHECEIHASNGEKAAVMCMENEVEEYGSNMVISLGNSYDTAAHGLFKALREMDEKNVRFIYIRAFDNEGLGMALMNRLVRAAGHKIIEV